MPKNTNAHGPTYAGHADVSSPNQDLPVWADLGGETADADPTLEVDDEVSRETKRRPGRPKGSKNATTAKAGNAAAEGSTRA